MTTPAHVTFSDLIQKPTKTIALMLRSQLRGLRLTRRGEPDLYITTAARAEAVTEVVRASTRMFEALLRQGNASHDLLARALPEAYPWVRFLPEGDPDAFLTELIETSRASTDLNAIAPIYDVIASWKNTAQIWADPELAAILSSPSDGDDYGPVSMPEPTA
jgi:hypothetical protein